MCPYALMQVFIVNENTKKTSHLQYECDVFFLSWKREPGPI